MRIPADVESSEARTQQPAAAARQLEQERRSNSIRLDNWPAAIKYYFSDKNIIICYQKYDWWKSLLTKRLVCLDNKPHDRFLILTQHKNNIEKRREKSITTTTNNSPNQPITISNAIRDNPQKNDSNFKKPSKGVKSKQIAKPLVVFWSLFLVLAIFNPSRATQNAVNCFRPGSPQWPDNFGIASYYNPYQSPMTQNNNHRSTSNARGHHQLRSLDQSFQMPPSGPNNMDSSFYNDPSANVPSSSTNGNGNDPLQGWPSILPSILNPNPRPNQQQHQPDSLDKHIKNILVPRVSGSEGNMKVRDYIVSSLQANNYKVELDEFTDNTPIGKVKFANIIADSNPKACRQLVIACHYDSKMMDGFLGAVDSAVPCSMMLKMSETFSRSFREEDNNNLKDSLGLRFIFFDGEEAFENWGPTDSLYGSRHLAQKWQETSAPNYCELKNELKRIELFLILDLIGSSDTTFVMYNRDLKQHYNNMMKYEREYLTRSGVGLGSIRSMTAFKNRHIPIHVVEDDHTPFLKRGVPILSLLAHPFPQVWHEVSDNYDAIDFQRTRRILHVLEEFVSNYKK